MDRLDPGLEGFFFAVIVLGGAKVKFLGRGGYGWVQWWGWSGCSWWDGSGVSGWMRLVLIGINPQGYWV